MSRETYRCNVEEQPGQVPDDTINILVLLDEAVSLAVSDLPNHIKSIEL